MHPNKIILTIAISYLIVYLIVYYVATHMNFTGDAAGKGMAAGYTLLLVMAIFFIVAIVLSVINYFLLKRADNMESRFFAFVPIITSLGHMVYTYFFG